MSSVPHNILVVIGTGGMGLAIARRLSGGRQLLLADNSTTQLQSAAELLRQEGHSPETSEVDVSDRASVAQLAQRAAQLGRVDAIIHTAGISPVTGVSKRIYEVDLVGTANVIAEFEAVASRGTSLVCIASMAAQLQYIGALSPDFESHLAMADTDKLLEHADLDFDARPEAAYSIAKRANLLRVQAASRQWGTKGARINTVSPGVTSTAMGRGEMEGPLADHIQQMIALTPLKRVGTADDVSSAVAFLVGPESSYITGTDLIVDGGTTPALRWTVGKL